VQRFFHGRIAVIEELLQQVMRSTTSVANGGRPVLPNGACGAIRGGSSSDHGITRLISSGNSGVRHACATQDLTGKIVAVRRRFGYQLESGVYRWQSSFVPWLNCLSLGRHPADCFVTDHA
jgi:hypothetical protein